VSSRLLASNDVPGSRVAVSLDRPALVEGCLSFEETLHKFLSYLKVRNYSEKTLIRYRRDLNFLFGFLSKHRAINSLDDVTKKDLMEYENEVYSSTRIKDGKPLSQESKVGRIVALKSFYNFLSKTELIPFNPASTIDIPVVRHSKLREFLTEDEAIKLLEAANGQEPLEVRNRTIMELLYSTGMRADELLNVNVKDVDLERTELRIRFGKGRMGKRERLVPIGKIAAEWLKVYIAHTRPVFQKRDDQGYLFISKNGRKLLIADPNRIVKFYAKKAGIEKKIVCHSLRHSCATHMHQHGCDIRFIQELLGHDSIETTTIYTRLAIDDLKEIHDKTHPRELDAS
jgi:integrase/recombinase XerD